MLLICNIAEESTGWIIVWISIWKAQDVEINHFFNSGTQSAISLQLHKTSDRVITMRKLMILCLAAVSFSSMATTSGVAFMEQMDSDDDGYITLREAVKNTDLLREFGHIDIDEDGKISEAELIASDYGREVLSLPI